MTAGWRSTARKVDPRASSQAAVPGLSTSPTIRVRSASTAGSKAPASLVAGADVVMTSMTYSIARLVERSQCWTVQPAGADPALCLAPPGSVVIDVDHL
jgi:hypothetical protein